MDEQSGLKRAPVRLALWLLAAGVGLGLFFSGGPHGLPLPFGWLGTLLFVVAVWFAVGEVLDGRRDEDELRIPAAEWQAWIGMAFLGVILVVLFRSLSALDLPVPIPQNRDLHDMGMQVGGWFAAWAVLAHALQVRWGRHAQEDEWDLQIQREAQRWAQVGVALPIVALAVTFGFAEPAWLAQHSYAYWGQLMLASLVVGGWVQHARVAWVYARERRAALDPA